MNGYGYGYGYGYGCSILINDNEGNELVCTLDSYCTLDECNEVVCTLDGNRKVPRKLEELSERERSSCRRSISVLGA